MKGLAIFLYVIFGILAISTFVGVIQIWGDIFDSIIAGVLFSIFVFFIAITGAPIANASINHDWTYILGGYLWYALLYGIVFLATWLYEKAEQRKEKRLLEKEYVQRYIESLTK
jgi:hypothetical protein